MALHKCKVDMQYSLCQRGGVTKDPSSGDNSKKALLLQGARYLYHTEISHEQTW